MSTRPPALSAICSVRHGVSNGAVRSTLASPMPGVSAALKRAALDAAQVHAGVVDQRRFVDRDVQAVVGAQRDRRLRVADLLDRRAVVEVFLAVPLERPGSTTRWPASAMANSVSSSPIFTDFRLGWSGNS